MRLGFRDLAADAKLAVSLNGRPLPPGRRFTTSQLVKFMPKQPDLAQDYYHVALAKPGILARGANAFEISVSGLTKPAELTDLEVRFDYQNDYVKLWEREPVQLNGAAGGASGSARP